MTPASMENIVSRPQCARRAQAIHVLWSDVSLARLWAGGPCGCRFLKFHSIVTLPRGDGAEGVLTWDVDSKGPHPSNLLPHGHVLVRAAPPLRVPVVSHEGAGQGGYVLNDLRDAPGRFIIRFQYGQDAG